MCEKRTTHWDRKLFLFTYCEEFETSSTNLWDQNLSNHWDQKYESNWGRNDAKFMWWDFIIYFYHVFEFNKAKQVFCQYLNYIENHWRFFTYKYFLVMIKIWFLSKFQLISLIYFETREWNRAWNTFLKSPFKPIVIFKLLFSKSTIG